MSDQFPKDGNSAKADFEVCPESGSGLEAANFRAKPTEQFLGGGGPKPDESDATQESVPSPGFVRLYRGEALGGRPMPGVSSRQGRWFTNSLADAQQIAKERVTFQGGTPQITYVDVTIEDADKFFGKKQDTLALPDSYLLPTDVAARKAVLRQALRRDAQSDPTPPANMVTETLPKPLSTPAVEATPVQKMDVPKPEAEKTTTTRASRSLLERVGQRIKNLRLPKTS